MAQALRHTKAAKPYPEAAREHIKLGKAIEVLNRVIEGEKLPEQRVKYAYAVYNKELPSYQAIAIDVSHQQPVGRMDLLQRAAALGLTEDMLFKGHTIDSKAVQVEGDMALEGAVEPDTQEKNVSPGADSDPPTPEIADA